MKNIKIALGADHAGYELKNLIEDYLIESGYEVEDFGTDSPESVDYPDFGIAVGEAVASGRCQRGIVCCGTGIGISIAANKVKGVRCALCSEPLSAALSREHNDSNVLSMGARIIGVEMAKKIVDAWLASDYAGGRHQRRLDIISRYEEIDSEKAAS